MDAIEPFSYDKMKAFSMKYLSGFMAQKYDVPYDQILPRIHKRIDEHAVKTVEKSISGYSSHVVTSHNVQMENIQHDYALLPVLHLGKVPVRGCSAMAEQDCSAGEPYPVCYG